MKSYIIDTNIFLRYLIKDNEDQFAKASDLIQSLERKKAVGKVSLLVIAEAIWVLQSVYKIRRQIFIPKLLNLIAIKNMRIIEIDKKILINVLKKMINNKFDLVDLYLSEIAKSKEIFSFDKDFKKLHNR